jgi:hypothetical protein
MEKACYLIVYESDSMGVISRIFTWTSDLQTLAENLELQQFAHLSEEQENDGYYKTGHEMWQACRAPPQPTPLHLHQLAWFHAHHNGGYTLYQLPLTVTDQLWINDDEDQLTVSIIPTPNWKIVARQ